MSSMTTTKKSKTALIVSIVAALLSVVTFLGLLLGIGGAQNTTETVNTFMYTRGAITSAGKIVESKESLYMEDMQTVSSMKIEIEDENATITYKVAFYDKDKKFLSMSDSTAEDFDILKIPESSCYFRVVITPNEVDGEAVKLNIFNMGKYTKQLSVSYDKV